MFIQLSIMIDIYSFRNLTYPLVQSSSKLSTNSGRKQMQVTTPKKAELNASRIIKVELGTSATSSYISALFALTFCVLKSF